MGASGSRGEGEGGSEPTILQLSSGMRILLNEGNVRVTVASFSLITLMNPAGH